MRSKIKSFLHYLNRRDLSILPKLNNKHLKLTLIVVISVLTIFITKNILATEAIPSEAVDGFKQKQSAMEEGNNQESWMKESAGSNAMVGINVLAGTVPDDVLEGKKNTSWTPGGLIGFTNKSIAMLYKVPISGVEYIAYIKNNLLGKPAYAESGFEGLKPIMELWKGFRNTTYVLFSLVFVIMGIMIMLRIKISPQAVINIQNSIPKIITSLILVTFSYAIVGLLVDFSYVITGLGISIIKNSTPNIPDFYTGNIDTSSTLELATNPYMFGKLFEISNIGGSPWILTTGLVNDIILNASGAGNIVGWIIGALAYIIVFLVLLIFIFVNMVKFAFGIAKCYVVIILKTIIAPLEIALGAIPGIKMGFGKWFIDIFANFMVFPISLIILTLIKKIMDTLWNSTYMWAPSMISSISDNGHFIATLFGLGGLLLLAKLPKLIPEFIFQIKPSPFGQAIGEAVGTIPGLRSAKAAGQTARSLAVENVMTSRSSKSDVRYKEKQAGLPEAGDGKEGTEDEAPTNEE
ncbi:MAG: hypothetical protein PHX34_02755 [Candidatus Shapirobacteria bacterium]|nr:hypothetical protein [Candidatus Shapirobacteria bacterium]